MSEDKSRVDNLINLETRLRDDAALAAGQPFSVEFLKTDFDLHFEAGTTESLIDEAAKSAGLEVAQHGKDLALLRMPHGKVVVRNRILRRHG
jgi:hypothetical protein